ncbi:hypothetical protein [Methylomonas koyamae]|uniref:hypothetical protein n=1 Tax=Methylomonas koyamae TaxID=702114 RepID=UPI0006CF948A|nr:hypothetical protein [Methylomonas koyamae]BBL57540.1 hypothetical protein MKFW12EY_11530 [Methylomonas koyamae]
MKTKLLFTLILAVGLLSACSEMNPHPMDMSQAVQNATSRADHEALAQHYEEAAKEMQLKVDEHNKLLSQYRSIGYRYGRPPDDFVEYFIDHCQRLIDVYEKAVEENLSMANLHRQK